MRFFKQGLYLLVLSDLTAGNFYHVERTNRSGPAIAGVDEAVQRIWNGNWQIQWNDSDQSLQAVSDAPQEMRIRSCFITSGNHFSDYKETACANEDPNVENFLLIGDSHAAALWFGFSQEVKNAHILEATASGCAPTLAPYDDTDCGKMRRYIYESLLPRLHVDGVILTEDWRSGADVEQIEPAIHWLQDRRIPVIIVGPVQEYDAPLPMLLAFSIKRNEPTLPQLHLLSRVRGLDRTLQNKAAKWHVVYLSPWQESCGSGSCLHYADQLSDVPMLIDSNHLTNKGSELLMNAFGDVAP